MTYLYSFLFCGFVCLIAQIILDNTKLTAGHITSIFVVVGVFLDVFNIYDKIINKVRKVINERKKRKEENKLF